ncbi:MAG: 6-pyruvoyl tetrahydropterin synthase family protein [Planctomycetia bacterium]|nr:6-pyruvoyl tetrahydropterin synthase family protein [Planctomycetia bacterium]
MTDRYEVRLRKATHVFCAGHFITLTDDLCEPVHGHNWTVGVDVEGRPDPHGMVVDFIALRDAVTAILAGLDHKMLLPTANPWLTVATAPGPCGGDEVTVIFKNRRRWVFPADECVLLPVANTTAEWIARWIGTELDAALHSSGHAPPAALRVSVDECLGQSAVWERIG